MRKHKLLLVLLALLIGTSLAFAIFIDGSNGNLEEDQGENAGLYELNTAGIHEQESEEEIHEEEAPDEDEADPDQALRAELIEEKDEASETAEAKEEKPVETPKPAEEPKPDPVKNQMARVTVNGLNVRPDPSTNNDRVDLLQFGQTVEVLAEQNGWLQVKLSDGRTGWISGAYVSRFSPSAADDSLAGRVIVIDPGHGGTDPGAVGANGLQEKEVVLDVSLRAAAKLRDQGAEVVMTRDTDVFIPLTQRVTIAENARAEVFVSVHANAHPDRSIGGTETYYFGNKASSSASRNLATLMQRELVGALRLRDIGVKEASFLVIRQTSMPSVLLELAFLSNAQEESLMRTNEFRQKAADAIVRALKDYFN